MSLDGDYFGEIGPVVNYFAEKLNSRWRFEISDFAGESVVFLSMLFFLCMVCHGEVVRCRPPARFLTEFYMMVSAGGALGGIFVGLICPQLFSFYVELSIGLVAGFMVAVGVLWDELWQSFLLNKLWKKCVAFLWGFGLLLLVVRAQFNAYDSKALLLKRNFYGVLKVKEEDYGGDDKIRELLNGRILHGSQFLDPLRGRMPITYYDSESGVGIAATLLRKEGPMRVAVVGLGTGTMAAYGGQGDYYCFYEINPNVPEIATSQFTYLNDSPADIHIELGDARISMERQEVQNYDLIVLDAFSGDAIPVHLLTNEAFEQYFRHLKPKGVIAVHISNRHLDLSPVVFGMSQHFNVGIRTVNNDNDDGIGDAASEWVLLTHNREFLEAPALKDAGTEVNPEKKVPLWTDQYSNLFQILE
jgi:spermidine synthase